MPLTRTQRLTMNLNKVTTTNPLELIFFVAMVSVTGWLLMGPNYLLAPLPAVGILFFIALLYNPHFGYYIIIFLIPFSTIMETLGLAQYMTISKLVGVWLVIYVTFRAFIERSFPSNFSSRLWPLLSLFFIVNLIATFTSEFTALGFDNVRQLLSSYLFYGLTLIFITENGFYKTLPALITASISFNSILSFIGFLFVLSVLSSDTDILRATGFSGDPNFFAALSLFGIPIVAHQIKVHKKISMKIFFTCALIIAICAVVLSFSRSSFRVLLIVLALLAFEYIPKVKAKQLGWIAVSVATSVVLALILIPSSYWERQQSLTDSSIDRRVTYLFVAWDTFKKHPLLGVGPGAFPEEYANSEYAHQFAEELFTDLNPTKKNKFTAEFRQKVSRQLSELYDELYKRAAHNTYLEVVAGSGGLGLIVFLAILVTAMKSYLRAISLFRECDDEESASQTKSYFLSMIAIMLAFMFLSSVYHKFFWLPIAMSQVALRLAEKKIELKNANTN